jgi:dihydrofolate reductase
MRDLILKMSVTIDGFVGGPNGELDWLFATQSDEAAAWTIASISRAGIHAMGARTFRDMASYWPTSSERFAPPMNAIPKVVFARSLTQGTTRALEDARAQGTPNQAADPALMQSWMHPRIASGDLVEEVARLKAEPGNEICAHGGASFARSLVQHDLVDEYRLLVHPVILGRGLRLFPERDGRLDLELVEVTAFPKGAAAHVYRRSRPSAT